MDDAFYKWAAEVLQKQSEKPAHVILQGMIDRGAIDKDGNVLLRGPYDDIEPDQTVDEQPVSYDPPRSTRKRPTVLRQKSKTSARIHRLASRKRRLTNPS